jgi:hypothetical protein
VHSLLRYTYKSKLHKPITDYLMKRNGSNLLQVEQGCGYKDIYKGTGCTKAKK